MGQSEVDEAQTAPFGMRIGLFVFGEHFVAGLHALEAAILDLREGRWAQQVGPFLLLLRPLLFTRRHCYSVWEP